MVIMLCSSRHSTNSSTRVWSRLALLSLVHIRRCTAIRRLPSGLVAVLRCLSQCRGQSRLDSDDSLVQNGLEVVKRLDVFLSRTIGVAGSCACVCAWVQRVAWSRWRTAYCALSSATVSTISASRVPSVAPAIASTALTRVGTDADKFCRSAIGYTLSTQSFDKMQVAGRGSVELNLRCAAQTAAPRRSW